MPTLFVSYRQSDARGWAVALRDELVLAFGDDAVFFDADSLHAGRWSDQIADALAACKVLIVVMGHNWLGARDAQGRRRLDDPDDVHRREVEHALGNAGVTVMPVFVDGAQMPPAADLPASLHALTLRQGLTWSSRANHRAADRTRLLAELHRLTGLAPRRPPAPKRWRPWAAALLGGSVITLVLNTGFSMADMPLQGAEMLVVFAAGAAIAALATVGWTRWRRPGRST